MVHSRGLLMGAFVRFIVLHARVARKQAAFESQKPRKGAPNLSPTQLPQPCRFAPHQDGTITPRLTDAVLARSNVGVRCISRLGSGGRCPRGRGSRRFAPACITRGTPARGRIRSNEVQFLLDNGRQSLHHALGSCFATKRKAATEVQPLGQLERAVRVLQRLKIRHNTKRACCQG